MTTRLSILNHVFDIMEIPREIQDALKDNAIKSVGALINLDQSELMQIQEIRIGHIQALLLFKSWFSKYIGSNGNVPSDWISTFTEDVWEDFMLKEAVLPPPPLPIPPVTSSSVPTTSNTTIFPSIKIDIKSYPEFSGKLKDWKVLINNLFLSPLCIILFLL